ncbi:hypothetical protein GW17_00022850 [Ensete ventricosum]|nr:hypothetical protein GW17_00022850 [Ensete ventricosum]
MRCSSLVLPRNPSPVGDSFSLRVSSPLVGRRNETTGMHCVYRSVLGTVPYQDKLGTLVLTGMENLGLYQGFSYCPVPPVPGSTYRSDGLHVRGPPGTGRYQPLHGI